MGDDKPLRNDSGTDRKARHIVLHQNPADTKTITQGKELGKFKTIPAFECL